MTVRALGDKVLKAELCMIAPDVEIDDGKGTILISSEEGETDDIADRLLKDFNIKDGCRLKCDDFLQNYNLNITILEMKSEEQNEREKTVGFEIIGDRTKLNPKEEESAATNGAGDQPSTSKGSTFVSFM